MAWLELINIPLWGYVLGLLAPYSVANLVGFLAFSVLLVQGSAYWFAKLWQLDRPGSRLPAVRWFAVARIVDPVFLAGCLGITGVVAITDPGIAVWPGIGLTVLAIAEYVNYFHIQLMHDNVADLRRLARNGLRRSHLAEDLAAHRRETTPRGE